MRSDFVPEGVIPACLMPFRADLSIDEAAYCKHLRDLATVEGIRAITINGHAAEVHALSFDEQKRALELTRNEVELPIIAGVFADGSLEAARIAQMAQQSGAAALLVFPPQSMALGGQQRPDMAREHFRRITAACDLPIILFQYPQASGLGYPMATLLDLCRGFPSIVAIKDWSADGALHEQHIHELHALERPVNVLTTHSAWLLGSLAMGCRGLLSGAGSVLASLHVALWRALQKGDLSHARAVNRRLYPTVRAFYDPPLLDMHNRMKEALVLLGRLESAHVRPPLMKLPAAEIQRIAERLRQAELTADNVYAPMR